MGLLEGLRIVELGDLGAWGTKLLADLGAEVILVEPPEGSATRRYGPFVEATSDSLYFAYFNTNKQSIALDLARPTGRDQLLALIDRCDAIVESRPPGHLDALGLGVADIAARRPDVVYCSVTPFGQTGPRRDWAADDTSLWALGGPMALCGLPERPPLHPPFDPAFIVTGCYAAIGVLAALRERRRSGRGQVIDLAMQEAVASIAEAVLFYPQHHGEAPPRLGTEHPATVPLRAFDLRDGQAYIIGLSDPQWLGLLDWMGETTDVELLRHERLMDWTQRTIERDLIHDAIAAWAADKTVEEIVREGQERRVPAARVNTPATLVDDEHLATRGFWTLAELPGVAGPVRFPGAPARFPEGSWAIRTPAPFLDADRDRIRNLPAREAAPEGTGATSSGGPLAGVRILDFTWVWAGPFATALLADLGAEVIKVESVGYGDYNRHAPPFAGRRPDPERAAAHLTFNRNKRSAAINLRDPRGRDLVRRLVRDSDAVIENWSAGTLERVGLPEDVLRSERPNLILARLSGFGQDGPYSRFVSFAPALHGMSGMTNATGYPDGQLAGPGIALADFLGGLIGAFSVVAAVTARDRDGQGRTIDVGQFETAVATLGPFLLDYLMNGHIQAPAGNQTPYRPDALHLVLPTADADRWVTLQIDGPVDWDRLETIPGIPAMKPADTVGSAPATAAEIESGKLDQWTQQYPAGKLLDLFQQAGLPAGIVQNGFDLLADPHLDARGYWLDVSHPRAGTLRLPRQPLIFSRTPAMVRHAGPLLGQHTDDVLREIAGVSEADIADLRAASVIG